MRNSKKYLPTCKNHIIESKRINTDLLEAVGNCDIPKVKTLLKEGADVNTKGRMRQKKYENKLYTPLILAAENGFVDLVKKLLEVPNIRVNDVDDFGRTALHKASKKGHFEVVKALLTTQGIVTNGKDTKNNSTPLHLASENGHTEVVKVLLKSDSIKVNKKNKYGITALHHAAEKGMIDIVRILLSAPEILVNEKDGLNSRTPLHIATELRHADVIKELLNHPDSDINGKDNCGQTALHISAYNDDVEAVKMLLEAGVDTKLCDSKNCTAIQRVKKHGLVFKIMNNLQ